MDRLITVIIPTYNERDNLTTLVTEIHQALSGHEYEILFVDDNSQDGTAELANELAARYPVRVLVRRNERGLASAVVYGFKHARGDIMVVMDADGQHPPPLLPDMLAAVAAGADLVIASRYVPGGSSPGWGLRRRMMSKGAIFLAHLLLPRTRPVADLTAGYFALRRSVVDGAELKPTGYKILLEVLLAGHSRQVTEVPYSFRLREKGESKLNSSEQIAYLKHLLSLMKRGGELGRFLRFCLVGASGVLVNEGLLWLLNGAGELPLALASAISIEAAIISNFALNDFFTFPDRRAPGRRSFLRRLAQFNAVSLVGLGINLGILLLLTEVGHVHYLLANLVGIAIAMLWNYLVNLGWTWR